MDNIFYGQLLLGSVVGLGCVIAGICLLFKRMQGQTEVKIKAIGEIRTSFPGIFLIFVGALMFYFSMNSYGKSKKLLAMGEEVQKLTYALENSNIFTKEGTYLVFMEPKHSQGFLCHIPILGQFFTQEKDAISVKGIIERDEENRVWLVMEGLMSVGDKTTVKLMVNNISKDIARLIGGRVEVTGVPVILQNTKGENYIAFSILHIKEIKEDH